MNIEELKKHFTYQELVEGYASLLKIENIISTMSNKEDSSFDFNYFSLDIVENMFHLYCGFNSTSYTGNNKEIIFEKILNIKSDLQRAIKELSKLHEN